MSVRIWFFFRIPYEIWCQHLGITLMFIFHFLKFKTSSVVSPHTRVLCASECCFSCVNLNRLKMISYGSHILGADVNNVWQLIIVQRSIWLAYTQYYTCSLFWPMSSLHVIINLKFFLMESLIFIQQSASWTTHTVFLIIFFHTWNALNLTHKSFRFKRALARRLHAIWDALTRELSNIRYQLRVVESRALSRDGLENDLCLFWHISFTLPFAF